MNAPNTAVSAALVAAALAGATAASAQSFTYHDDDLLVGFRQTGAAQSLLVNVGNVSSLLLQSQLAHHSVVIGNAGALNSTFGSLGGLRFSAAAANRFGPAYPLNTLWISRPSPDALTVALPWNRQGAGTLGTTATRISSLGNGGVTVASIDPTDVLADGIVRIPSGNNNAVGRWVGSTPSGNGPLGNFNNTFQGNAEQVTPPVFASGWVREDLFQIEPGSGQSTWVASILLSHDGTMRFAAVPEPGTYAAMTGAALAAFALWRRRAGRGDDRAR